ncbi:MAG TPA: bacillithiol biosynthesis cysteine-adding enzyme BshC [Candidatus Acidoferrum sp.]|nr:bacillithiol biosynthesis cysteine-adding enzyme BshC [Candidatus Acidoferrum sp.]
MDCRTLPFRQLPHQPKLFLQFVDSFSRVAAFYAHPPTMQWVKREARKLKFPQERRAEVVSALRAQNEAFGSGEATLENLRRLEKGAVAVVTGQQVGLFSGPAYAIYKALTAIQLAEELTRTGVRAVPVFWMATEDHDLEEIRHSTWFQAGKLERFELPITPEAGKPVGQISLGPQVEEMAREAAALLSSQGSDLLANFLRESYRAEETYGSAFGKLFARLFAERGLILLDPLDVRLHRVAAPIYRQALEDRDVLSEKLLQRAKELDKADFPAQVKVTSRSTLLFRMCKGLRQAIGVSNGKFQSGNSSWTREELLRLVEAEPECFSPNALLRAVVQDYLLPTAAYVAGPTEIAYFAQAEVIYRHLLGRMPVILPRAGFTLLDAKAEKLLRHYHLKVEDVWSGSQELRRKMETSSVPNTLAKDFDKSAKQTERMLSRLKKQIVRLDPTLAGAVETAQRKIAFQLEKLKGKAGQAQDQKAGLIAGHKEFLESLLYPHKALQSRELCLLPFLARWGTSGLKELQKLCGSGTLKEHKILRIP